MAEEDRRKMAQGNKGERTGEGRWKKMEDKVDRETLINEASGRKRKIKIRRKLIKVEASSR